MRESLGNLLFEFSKFESFPPGAWSEFDISDDLTRLWEIACGVGPRINYKVVVDVCINCSHYIIANLFDAYVIDIILGRSNASVFIFESFGLIVHTHYNNSYTTHDYYCITSDASQAEADLTQMLLLGT